MADPGHGCHAALSERGALGQNRWARDFQLVCDLSVGDAFLRQQQDPTSKRDLLRGVAIANQRFQFPLLIGGYGQRSCRGEHASA